MGYLECLEAETEVRTEKEFLTPPDIARRLRVRRDKVLGWIRSGELRAADVSQHRGSRPRWRVHQRDLGDFLDRRVARSPVKTSARTRESSMDVVEFF